MKPLFIPLKTRWFREFAEGRKNVEYRVYGPRWHEGTCVIGRDAVISHGYSGDRLSAVVSGFRKIELGRAPVEAQKLFAGHTHLAEIALDFNL